MVRAVSFSTTLYLHGKEYLMVIDFMILYRDRDALDGSLPPEHPARNVTIPEGCHVVERVPNPYGYRGDWIVLANTMRGNSEEHWLEFVKSDDPRAPKIPPDFVVEFLEIDA